jgi:predicted nucleotidyltransferase
MKFGLEDYVLEKFKSVFIRYPEIDEVLIYGSRAKGNFRIGSDIDLALKGESLNDSIAARLANDIDNLNLVYLVDLLLINQTENESLLKEINSTGIAFYSKND